MILSFHPCFRADHNIICAGRPPGAGDLAAIRAASAVILSQGCSQALFEMARANCRHVFPNYDARFSFAGKLGQIRLFRQMEMAHPRTESYKNLACFHRRYGRAPKEVAFSYPFVFKFDWGGEGHTVYCISSAAGLEDVLQKAQLFEKSGQVGFLIQEYIPNHKKSLRVAVVGREMISYWRIQQRPGSFHASLSRGAHIDGDAEPVLRQKAITAVKAFCEKTGINLAGFDVLFSSKDPNSEPLLLEINYFFGRRGLGGSERYYQILCKEIDLWLKALGLHY
ncbi:MAG: hypothetical protein JSW39_06815 [Desulfobacterales bacterium]|nr:MAG: hypothetical protein JSW39_06815 [Desulfobacterales bacterium]